MSIKENADNIKVNRGDIKALEKGFEEMKIEQAKMATNLSVLTKISWIIAGAVLLNVVNDFGKGLGVLSWIVHIF